MPKNFGEKYKRKNPERPFKRISFERLPGTDNEQIFLCCDGTSHFKVRQLLLTSAEEGTTRLIPGTETDCNCEDPSATKDVFDIFK